MTAPAITTGPVGVGSGVGEAVTTKAEPVGCGVGLPPAADLSLGLTFTPSEKLVLRGSVFNAFNARYYQSDVFYSYEPRLEFLPNPWEDWRAYVSAEYTY